MQRTFVVLTLLVPFAAGLLASIAIVVSACVACPLCCACVGDVMTGSVVCVDVRWARAVTGVDCEAVRGGVASCLADERARGAARAGGMRDTVDIMIAHGMQTTYRRASPCLD